MGGCSVQVDGGFVYLGGSSVRVFFVGLAGWRRGKVGDGALLTLPNAATLLAVNG